MAEGVPENNVLAYMWMNLLATQGDERAQRNKQILGVRMTREQIAEGQRLPTEWIEAHPPGAVDGLVRFSNVPTGPAIPQRLPHICRRPP